MHPQPESSPLAGQDTATVDPNPPQRVDSGRSTRSKFCFFCVLETVLAAVVFFYTAVDFAYWASLTDEKDHEGVVHEAFFFVLVMALMLTDGAFGIVLFVTGSAVRTGASHSLGKSNPRGATSSGEDVDRLERGRLAESLELDGVDLFDFHELVTTSVSILLGISSFLLLQLVSVILSLPFSLCLVFFSSHADSETENVAFWLFFVALELFAFTRLLERLRFCDRFRKLEQSCRTEPGCKLVRAVVVSSGVLYALVLYFSPAPSLCLWGLVVMHAARSLKLVVSLRDQSERMGAGTGVAQDDL